MLGNKIMLKFLFICLLFECLVTQAQEPCWSKEYNYFTPQKTYLSEELYQQHLNHWKEQMPKQPSLAKLARAYFIFKEEKAKANNYKKDKVKHCYIGCRLSQRLDFKTTHYVGWYKEQEDLTDCELRTHFEPKDLEATLDGAKHPGSATQCQKYCHKNW
jgi:hypothetical protein